MKRFTHLFLLSFSILLIAAARPSKQQVYLQLTDPSGQMIRGASMQRGYERQIIATSFSGVTTGNPQVQFSMSSSAASATLTTLQGSKSKLPFAVFTITQYAEQGSIVIQTVRLEGVIVIKTEDANGSTNVTLQADRIGTTYFQYNRKTGIRSVSGKTGYDFTSKKEWTEF